jgi:hypothetical protein
MGQRSLSKDVGTGPHRIEDPAQLVRELYEAACRNDFARFYLLPSGESGQVHFKIANMNAANQPRQPTPGVRLGACSASLAWRGCTLL